MSKFDNTKHVGVINNVRFTKELFKDSMDKVEADVYKRQGAVSIYTSLEIDLLCNVLFKLVNLHTLLLHACLLYTSRGV